MLVYVAGPYRSKTPEGVVENIENARRVAIDIWESGNVAICPHLNTARFELDCRCEDTQYLTGDLQILARCDSIVMIPGWENSEGAKVELAFAEAREIPVYYYPDLPRIHPTE